MRASSPRSPPATADPAEYPTMMPSSRASCLAAIAPSLSVLHAAARGFLMNRQLAWNLSDAETLGSIFGPKSKVDLYLPGALSCWFGASKRVSLLDPPRSSFAPVSPWPSGVCHVVVSRQYHDRGPQLGQGGSRSHTLRSPSGLFVECGTVGSPCEYRAKISSTCSGTKVVVFY